MAKRLNDSAPSTRRRPRWRTSESVLVVRPRIDDRHPGHANQHTTIDPPNGRPRLLNGEPTGPFEPTCDATAAPRVDATTSSSGDQHAGDSSCPRRRGPRRVRSRREPSHQRRCLGSRRLTSDSFRFGRPFASSPFRDDLARLNCYRTADVRATRKRGDPRACDRGARRSCQGRNASGSSENCADRTCMFR